MRMNKPSLMLTNITTRILDLFRKQNLDDMTAGVRFDAPESQWRAGYGTPFEKELPDFVKEDNAGWVYLPKSKK